MSFATLWGPVADKPLFYPSSLNLQVHGLRGLAALLVFVYHIYGMAVLWGFWPTSLVDAFGWMRFGRHGVELFFIISGYLIAGSVVRHGNVRSFLLDRCIRIYPVFLTIHLLVFGLGPLVGYRWMSGISLTDWVRTFAENVLFLPGLFDLPLAQLNAWSLSYEAGFYLSCAAIYVVARRCGHVAGWAIALLMAAFLVWLYPKAAFFLVGVAIYLLKTGRPAGGSARLHALSPILFGATLALLSIDESATALVYLACAPGFVFFWSILDGDCPLSAMLRCRGLQYLGTISYSFYLWSAVVTYPLKLIIVKMLPGPIDSLAPVILFAAAGLALSLAAAHLSFQWLEEQAGRTFRRMVHHPHRPRFDEYILEPASDLRDGREEPLA